MKRHLFWGSSCLLAFALGSQASLAQPTETEPNDTWATSNAATLPSVVHGAVNPGGDHDVFSFSLATTTTLTFFTSGDGDAVIDVYAADCTTLLAHNDDDCAGKNAAVRLSLPIGTYYVVVSGATQNDTFPYDLTLFAGTSVLGGHVRIPQCCCGGKPTFSDPLYASFTQRVALGTFDPQPPGNNVVLSVYDLGDYSVPTPCVPPTNANWPGCSPPYFNPAWTLSNLGNVFGVTLDNKGNIFVAASKVLIHDTVGPGGHGAVYKIDRTTGAISTFVQLPNTPDPSNRFPSLGNLCYDCEHDQLFVTDFDDGRIYRIRTDLTLNPAGNRGRVLSTYDHGTFTIDSTHASADGDAEVGDAGGLVALGDRLWAVQVYRSRVYYSRWNQDRGHQSGSANEVWSIGLDSAGEFTTNRCLEVTIPILGSPRNYSNPVASIAFSPAGRMLLAERGMVDGTNPVPHEARALEYAGFTCSSGGSWSPGNTFAVGALGASAPSSAGGAAWDSGPGGRAFVTGDAIFDTSVYGIEMFPSTGGSTTNSFKIDMDNNTGAQDKEFVGAVAVPCFMRPCAKAPSGMVAWYPFDTPGSGSATNDLDIAAGNTGVEIGGPVRDTATPSYVGQSLIFNGTTSYVRGTSFGPFLGTGSLSVDTWIKADPAALGIRPIIDKRRLIGNSVRGWRFFLNNGNLGFTLADTTYPGQTDFLSTGPSVADGTWHNVAVTVERLSTPLLQIYIDGNVVASFNPAGKPGNIDAPERLRIGSGFAMTEPASYFKGNIDEVEIFNRALTSSEVQAIVAAGQNGKCKETCFVRYDAFGFYPSSIGAKLTVCNFSIQPQTYSWSIVGLPAGPGCSFNGTLLGFPTPSGFLNVNPHTCVTITIPVTIPPGMTWADTACFEISVTSVATLRSFKCRGAATTSSLCRWWPCVATGFTEVTAMPGSGGFTPITFNVTNLASPTPALAYEIRAVTHEDGLPSASISLNGQPPGTSIFGMVTVPLGSAVPVTANVSFVDYDAFQAHEIQFVADGDGNGVAEVLERVGVVLHTGDDCGLAGTVNAGRGSSVDVLRVNGSSGDSNREVFVMPGQPIDIALDNAPRGPFPGGYVLWFWRGGPGVPTNLIVGGSNLGCMLNPSPLAVGQRPQPLACAKDIFAPAEVVGSARLLRTPNFAPMTFRLGTLNSPITLSVQGIVEDFASGSWLNYSVTNGVIIHVQ
ncbi:MAG: LamG domain-containing protein [Planctomycetes bacterium]|nr:LamG domain-containing protein [Planctomycetota bacterium]